MIKKFPLFLIGVFLSPVLLSGVPTLVGAQVTAIIDTGIDADVLLGVRDEGVLEYDFVDDDNLADDQYETKHGTFLAVIFHSEAPSERIMPLKVTASKTDLDNVEIRQNAALQLANDTEQVGTIVLNNTRPLNGVLLQESVNKGKTIVINAGNQSAASPTGTATLVPSLNGAGIIVGGHKSDGSLATSSNRAGTLKEHYLAALYSAEGATIKGSSFASARVAAVAALVRSQNPGLSNAQVAEILFQTATDTGEAGVDAIYGWGILNKTRALSPIGEVVTPITNTEINNDDRKDEDNAESDSEAVDSENNGNQSGGGFASVALGALALGTVGYGLIYNNPDLKEALVLDEYERPFKMDLSIRTSIPASINSTKTLIKKLGTENTSQPIIKRSDFNLTASYKTLGNAGSWQLHDWDLIEEDSYKPAGILLLATLGDDERYAFGFNHGLSGFFDNISKATNSRFYPLAFRSDIFHLSPLTFCENGFYSAASIPLQPHWRAGFSVSSVDQEKTFGLKNDSAILHTNYDRGWWGLDFQLGLLKEDGNLLGSASGGALSVDATDTLSVGLANQFNLNQDWAILANYFEGVTRVNDRRNSMAHDFSKLRINKWGVSLLGRNIADVGDVVGIGWSQPLRAKSGDLTMTVPTGLNAAGGIEFNTRRTSLVTDGRENLIEIFYKRDVSKQFTFLAYLSHQIEPLHLESGSSLSTVLAALSFRN
ncbi:MAG: S8 family serine peptidase [Dehalococcoidia bacterium]|jgi:hypothetical protein|nr:S8 family serine peptidase [Dehalococcoidia bacterium]